MVVVDNETLALEDTILELAHARTAGSIAQTLINEYPRLVNRLLNEHTLRLVSWYVQDVLQQHREQAIRAVASHKVAPANNTARLVQNAYERVLSTRFAVPGVGYKMLRDMTGVECSEVAGQFRVNGQALLKRAEALDALARLADDGSVASAYQHHPKEVEVALEALAG